MGEFMLFVILLFAGALALGYILGKALEKRIDKSD